MSSTTCPLSIKHVLLLYSHDVDTINHNVLVYIIFPVIRRVPVHSTILDCRVGWIWGRDVPQHACIVCIVMSLSLLLFRVVTATTMLKRLQVQMTHRLQVYLHPLKIQRAFPLMGRTIWYLNHTGWVAQELSAGCSLCGSLQLPALWDSFAH